MNNIVETFFPSNEKNGWVIDPSKPCPGKKADKKVRPHQIVGFVPIEEEELQAVLLEAAFSNDKKVNAFFFNKENVVGFCRTRSILTLTYITYKGEELNSCILKNRDGYDLQVASGGIYDGHLSEEEFIQLSSGETITKWRTTTL